MMTIGYSYSHLSSSLINDYRLLHQYLKQHQLTPIGFLMQQLQPKPAFAGDWPKSFLDKAIPYPWPKLD